MTGESKSPAERRRLHIPAVPWKTSTEERVKSALGEVPSYIRRARRMEAAIEQLSLEVAEVRSDYLEFVCLRLRKLLDVLTEESGRQLPEATLHALGQILDQVDEHPAFLRLTARPRSPRGREVETVMNQFQKSVDRFNTRYARWLAEEAPLGAVNDLITGYNENYSFERQCALRYVPLDKVRFERRPLLSERDILSRYPLLPRP